MSDSKQAEGRALGAIIVGASTFPHFPKERMLDNLSFKRSAKAFKELLEDGGTLVAGKPDVLDLFDSEETPAEIVKRMKDFLRGKPQLTDIILYYCGHGAFLRDRRYYLVLRATEPDDEDFTGLPWRQTSQALEPLLAMKRTCIILDCCFAGDAVKEFMANALGAVIENETFESLPRRGASLIAASSKGKVALAPGDQPLTMFTSALVQTLSGGIPGAARSLTLRDVVADMRKRMQERFGARAVLPEIHDPVQTDGDVSDAPFFVNKGFVPPKEPEATTAEREVFEHATADLERPLAATRIAGLDTLAGLLAKSQSSGFRETILQRLRRCEAEDDSRAVVAKSTAILEAHRPKPAPQPPPQRDTSVVGRSRGWPLVRGRKAHPTAPDRFAAKEPSPIGPTWRSRLPRLIPRQLVFLALAMLALMFGVTRGNPSLSMLQAYFGTILSYSLVPTAADCVLQVLPRPKRKMLASGILLVAVFMVWYLGLIR